jgi:hypothetical protein
MTTEVLMEPSYYESKKDPSHLVLIEDSLPFYKVKMSTETVLIFPNDHKSAFAIDDKGETTQLLFLPSITEVKSKYIDESGSRLFRKNGPVVNCFEETNGQIYSFQHVNE